ncbi:MAG: MarC family protein [Thermoprotei archaeon]|nr:MarC family protein [Thermoprotei archaeon]
MSSLVRQLVESFIFLFIVFDAIGNAPIFLSLTKDFNPDERRKIYLRSVIVAGILLIFFMFLGPMIFSYYGVTLEDVKIAGGLLLLLIAIEGLLGREEAQKVKSESIAIVPLATPLLAGPGSIYVVIYIYSVYGFIPAIFSIIANTIVALIILNYISFVIERLGINVLLVISRIMAFILAVFAISMIRDGIMGIYKEVLKT